jgi:hypothetical protein
MALRLSGTSENNWGPSSCSSWRRCRWHWRNIIRIIRYNSRRNLGLRHLSMDGHLLLSLSETRGTSWRRMLNTTLRWRRRLRCSVHRIGSSYVERSRRLRRGWRPNITLRFTNIRVPTLPFTNRRCRKLNSRERVSGSVFFGRFGAIHGRVINFISPFSEMLPIRWPSKA